MDTQSILLLAPLLLLSIYLLFFFRANKHNLHSNGLKIYPLLGYLPQFLKNRHRFNDWMADILAATPTNTLVFRRPGNIKGVITANPANVEHMLKSNFNNYPKGPRFHGILHDFLGNGIFNADGHLWKVQRKTASFEFNTRSLRNFVVECVQHETVTRLLPLLKRTADGGQVIDIQDVLERYAFDNVCKVAFNEDPACLDESQGEFSSFADAFKIAAELSAERFRYLVPGFWKIKKLFGVGSEQTLEKSIATVHSFATQIIQSRMKDETQSDDLLSRFLALEAEDYSEEFLRDIVISFLLAGRETTSSALTWFFWLLSSRPAIQQKILDEIAMVRAQKEKCDTTFELDELREMQYMHAAITESMRLYPPVPVNMLVCQEDDVFPDGTEIKKGWFMSYQSYAMGRMEEVWGKDCKEYKPERWIDDDGMFRPESPFKFLAFHGGPRMCLGKEMAYIQMKSIAASVIEMFEVEVMDRDKQPEQVTSLTLRMRGGLPVRVKSRGVSV